jgi:hypothetical protein
VNRQGQARALRLSLSLTIQSLSPGNGVLLPTLIARIRFGFWSAILQTDLETEGRETDYGLVGEMSVLMNAHPLIGPALAELFMRVMFAPGALARPEREMIAAVAVAAQDCHY